LLSRLDSACLDLELVRSIFLDVFDGPASTGHLALFPDRHKGAIKSQGQRRPEEETSGFEADDDIWYLAAKSLLDQEHENIEQGAEGDGVLEYGEDVDKLDARNREVGFIS